MASWLFCSPGLEVVPREAQGLAGSMQATGTHTQELSGIPSSPGVRDTSTASAVLCHGISYFI